MALGKRPDVRQEELFVATSDIRRLSHPFYRALDRLPCGAGVNIRRSTFSWADGVFGLSYRSGMLRNPELHPTSYRATSRERRLAGCPGIGDSTLYQLVWPHRRR